MLEKIIMRTYNAMTSDFIVDLKPGTTFTVSSYDHFVLTEWELMYHFCCTSNNNGLVNMIGIVRCYSCPDMDNLESWILQINTIEKTILTTCRNCHGYVKYTDDIRRALNLSEDFTRPDIPIELCTTHDCGQRLDWNKVDTTIEPVDLDFDNYVFDIKRVDGYYPNVGAE